MSEDGGFLGVAGYESPDGAFIGGGLKDLAAVYGRTSAAIRGLLIVLLERNCADDTLLMDGIFVEPEARGRGVGKALLNAMEERAERSALRRVRLDVIDTKPRARALYEREGFPEASTILLGPLSVAFGFSHATEMTKSVGG